MKFTVEWTLAPHSLTLAELYATNPQQSFLHNGTIYAGILRGEVVAEDFCYAVLALDAALPTRLLGSTVVTPITPGPPIPLTP